MAPELFQFCNSVEACYECMLAYAAQGRSSDEADKPGGQIREFLQRAAPAQPSISSRLVDNLNASIQPRALLTDLFLIGEVLRAQPGSRTISQVDARSDFSDISKKR
jgi:hypothetical protein